MAAKHVREVQRNRKDILAKLPKLSFEILQVIATDVGNANEPAKTSHRGIAERAGCHFNTVGSHISKLSAAGFITVQKDGKFEYYVLNIETGSDEPKEDSGESLQQNVTILSQNDSELSQSIVTILSQIQNTLSQFSEKLSQIDEKLSQFSTSSELLHKSEEVKIEPPVINDTAEAPAPESTPVDAKHPAIIAWRTANKRYPPKRTYDFLAKELGESPDGEILGRVCTLWDASGYNPGNVHGKIQWYHDAKCYTGGAENWEPVYQNGKNANGNNQRSNAAWKPV